jgi:hypothetical protein
VGICRGRWWEFVEAVGGNRSLLDPGVAVFQALFFIDGVVGSSRIMILCTLGPFGSGRITSREHENAVWYSLARGRG